MARKNKLNKTKAARRLRQAQRRDARRNQEKAK